MKFSKVESINSSSGRDYGDYFKNLKYAKKVESFFEESRRYHEENKVDKDKFYLFINARLSRGKDDKYNILMFSFQTRDSIRDGNHAYPVNLNMNHEGFQSECRALYKFYKSMAEKLIEKIENKGDKC